MRAVIALVSIVSGAASDAWAQPSGPSPADAPEPGEPSPPLPPPEMPPVDAAPRVDSRSDAAWTLYHDAFEALLRGRRREASALVTRLQVDHPGHPAGQLALRGGLGAPGASRGPESPSSSARAELALFQTIHGVVLGVELCIVADCDGEVSVLGLALLGGAAGAGASLSLDELTSGQRALLNSGTVWGAANAGLLMAVADPSDGKSFALGLMAGQLGGLAIGAGLHALRPTSGQVGLANSGGQWALALTHLTLLAAGADLSGRQTAGVLLVAMDAGLGAGAYLASRFPQVSRAQSLVIDAAGIVGAVAGGGAGVLISGTVDERATPALAAAGAVIGLGAAAYLTRHWGDDDAPNVRAMLLPAPQGRGGLAGISLVF